MTRYSGRAYCVTPGEVSLARCRPRPAWRMVTEAERSDRAEPAAKPGSISAIVLTLDEELHISRCLDSLRWCPDVVVVDSFSNDGTVRIAQDAGVRVVQHRFQGFGAQRNWALDHVPGLGEWVLFLDADERVTPPLAREICRLVQGAPAGVSAYRVRRRFHIWGQWLPKSSQYPTWLVRLIRRGHARYENRGHGETQMVDGQVGELEHDLVDENLRGIEAWFARQNRYSSEEARLEEALAVEDRAAADLAAIVFKRDPLERRAAAKRLFARLPGRGAWYFAYSYLLRGGFLEGRDGLALCLMRSIYQEMIAIKRHDLRRRRGG